MPRRNKARRRKLFEKQNGICYYCKRSMTLEVERFNSCTVDHIIPLCKGGTNNMSNCVGACRNCNTVKSKGDAEYFLSLLEDREIKPFISIKRVLTKEEKRNLGEGVKVSDNA